MVIQKYSIGTSLRSSATFYTRNLVWEKKSRKGVQKVGSEGCAGRLTKRKAAVPFALTQSPAGDDPQGDHEDEKDGARTDGHQSLEHESRVEVDTIKGSDAARRGVGEQFAVQEHHSANEVEAQEHGQTESHVDRHPFGTDDSAVIGQFGSPKEVMFARNRMDGADDQFECDLTDPLPGHRNPPIVGAIVDQEQLHRRKGKKGKENKVERRCQQHPALRSIHLMATMND